MAGKSGHHQSSEHFIEGEPTLQNPLPTLKLGYSGSECRVKQITFFASTDTTHLTTLDSMHVLVRDAPRCGDEDPALEPSMKFEDPPMEMLKPDSCVHYIFTFLSVFIWMRTIIYNDRKKICALEKENMKLKRQINILKSRKYVDNLLKTDEDVTFHTGLKCKSVFDKLHDLIAPHVNHRWTGVKSMAGKIRVFKTTPARFGPERKLTSKCEFLLILMKLRLGLLNKDLSKHFDISESLCSRIFFAWLCACSTVLKTMIFMPDKETLLATQPNRFRDMPDLHSIIDCTEIFIETPKDLYLQGASWSDYKHHNTLKVLVACSANSLIIFISPAYLGRISDKALTLDCGYLDLLPPYSRIMADKGFNIEDECAARNLFIQVPAGKRGHSQMICISAKDKENSESPDPYIQVIRRIKTFRILAKEVPVSLINHLDDILNACCALCNLKEPIYKT